MYEIAIPLDVWVGANEINIMVEAIKAHGLKRNIPAELLPAGAFVPHTYKIADEKNPISRDVQRRYCDYWVGIGYGAKGTIISRVNKQTGKCMPEDCKLIHFQVRFKYQGEKITVQLNANEIELISLYYHHKRLGYEPSNQWIEQIEMILDEAMAVIYSKSPTVISDAVPAAPEKYKTKNPDDCDRFR